jgi:hypothetical protein
LPGGGVLRALRRGGHLKRGHKAGRGKRGGSVRAAPMTHAPSAIRSSRGQGLARSCSAARPYRNHPSPARSRACPMRWALAACLARQALRQAGRRGLAPFAIEKKSAAI